MNLVELITYSIYLTGLFLIYKTIIFVFGLIFGSSKRTSSALTGKIETELVPWDMQGINVRSRVDYKTWMKIAHTAHSINRIKFKLPMDCCEVCKQNGRNQGFDHPLEAHEEWRFDHETRTQRLARIRSLCPLCHKAVHIGLADKQGYGQRVRKHMAQVNGWSLDQVEQHIQQAKIKVKGMNHMGKYKLDLTYLNNAPYTAVHNFRFTKNETNNCQPNIYE